MNEKSPENRKGVGFSVRLKEDEHQALADISQEMHDRGKISKPFNRNAALQLCINYTRRALTLFGADSVIG